MVIKVPERNIIGYKVRGKVYLKKKMKGPHSLDTGYKLNLHKTFRRRSERSLNFLCTFDLCPVSKGLKTRKKLSFYQKLFLSLMFQCSSPNVLIANFKLLFYLFDLEPNSSWYAQCRRLW